MSSIVETHGELNVSGNIEIDGNGDGTIDFSVDNAWQRWEIDSVVVSTSQAPNQTPYPVAEIFAGPISPAFSQGTSWTGNQDTFTGITEISPGRDLHIVFTGGIPGTIARARVYGTKYTRRR